MNIIALDADAQRLWQSDSIIPINSQPSSNSSKTEDGDLSNELDIGFILSDDQKLDIPLDKRISQRSLGNQWLQGHMAIGICHFLIDEGVSLNI